VNSLIRCGSIGTLRNSGKLPPGGRGGEQWLTTSAEQFEWSSVAFGLDGRWPRRD
jgi:hypothetical protein